MPKPKRNWKKILQIMEKTKDLDVENVLIVPLEDWNPTILSKKRREILKVLRSRNVKSEQELANIVNRKRPNVLKDLKLLEHYGLIKMIRQGNRVVPKEVRSIIVTY
jgi:predicted transcriptional regulator